MIPKETIAKWERWSAEAEGDLVLGAIDADTVEGGLALEAVPALLAERVEMLVLLRDLVSEIGGGTRVDLNRLKGFIREAP